MSDPLEVREIPKRLQEEYAHLLDHDKYEYRWVKWDGVTAAQLGYGNPEFPDAPVFVMQRKLKS